MNKYITKELKIRWPQYEFVGRPFKTKSGKTYMRAYSKFFNCNHFYCFEDDFFWFDHPNWA